ncbi:class I SAM-dependent methyltransferase [Methanobrevibacter sp. TMH8]|uniref:class I SAM-dependent methyltransferase n=1 Tax=Methanobrevibacter sp. TMH8 TaxID=2848611 RepID=UPI001CCD853E|nr:class I SAM-dependent methyltransferase [Methanobrevibacter sp. TMH8]MBZ9571134.1 class I SAM-dependent methyltransferase [Methanobrevibacter sp. TMH8]
MFSKLVELFFRGKFGNLTGFRGKILAKRMNIWNQEQYNLILENIELKTNDIILEFGFGNGYLIKELFKQNIPIKIYGIDISKDMVDEAKIENKDNIENGDLKLFLGNINKTSFDEGFFDKIYTVNTLYFWDDINTCYSEIKRILKPNGIFMNVFHTKDYLKKSEYAKHGFKKYTLEEIKKITEDNGFKINNTFEGKDESFVMIAESID